MRVLQAALLALGALSLTATAHANGVDQPVNIPVTTTANIADFYPQKSQRMEITGWARLRCTVQSDTSLSNCDVVGEAPPYGEFGAAVLRLAPTLNVALEGPALAAVVGKPFYKTFHFTVPDGRMRPDLFIAPSADEMDAARPKDAEPEGMATLTCAAPIGGRGPFQDCVVDAESPKQQGFGAAARALATRSYKANLAPIEKRVSFILGRNAFFRSDGGLLAARAEHWVDPARFDQAEWRSSLVSYLDADVYWRQTPDRDLAESWPTEGVGLSCDWEAGGSLTNCQADRGTADAAARATLALVPSLKLVRNVTFNVNWNR